MDVIDQYVHRLDEIWAFSRFDEPALKGLIDEIPVRHTECDSIRVELCAADMEWRWRSARVQEFMPRPANSHSDEDFAAVCLRPPASALPGALSLLRGHGSSLPERPLANDYCHLMRHSWESDYWRSQLLLAEWRTRSAFGDQPDLCEFTGRSSQSHWKSALLTALEEIAWLRVTMHDSANAPFSKRLPAEFVMGRQFRDELPPPAWLAEDGKLVVAATRDTNISRQQIRVQRTKIYELTLTNLSSKVPIRLDNSVLPANGQIKLALPVRIGFSSLNVAIDTVAV